MNRKFLTDINIVGAMLASREGDILKITVPNLLKWCNSVLIMLDNEDECTEAIALELAKKHSEIEVAYTGHWRASKEEEIVPYELSRKLKFQQGLVRERIFQHLRTRVRQTGQKIDLLIWPDADEMFTESLPSVLESFWNIDDKAQGLIIRMIDVFGDMRTIHKRSAGPHTRIIKYTPEFMAYPYRNTCFYWPLTRDNRIGASYIAVHLALLNAERRKWRDIHWKEKLPNDTPLWNLPKDAVGMSPVEIKNILKQKPDLTIGEYLVKNKLII